MTIKSIQSFAIHSGSFQEQLLVPRALEDNRLALIYQLDAKGRVVNNKRLGKFSELHKELRDCRENPLTLSLWKGKNTNRPRNRRAPVLREMTTGVSRPQVVLATDLATAVRFANDRDLLKLSPSTLVFPDLRPAKEA
jgi:hypothetical protein